MNDGFRKHHGPRQSRGIDGPCGETKELVGAYWLGQVKSIDEAVEWLKGALLTRRPRSGSARCSRPQVLPRREGGTL